MGYGGRVVRILQLSQQLGIYTTGSERSRCMRAQTDGAGAPVCPHATAPSGLERECFGPVSPGCGAASVAGRAPGERRLDSHRGKHTPRWTSQRLRASCEKTQCGRSISSNRPARLSPALGPVWDLLHLIQHHHSPSLAGGLKLGTSCRPLLLDPVRTSKRGLIRARMARREEPGLENLLDQCGLAHLSRAHHLREPAQLPQASAADRYLRSSELHDHAT